MSSKIYTIYEKTSEAEECNWLKASVIKIDMKFKGALMNTDQDRQLIALCDGGRGILRHFDFSEQADDKHDIHTWLTLRAFPENAAECARVVEGILTGTISIPVAKPVKKMFAKAV